MHCMKEKKASIVICGFRSFQDGEAFMTPPGRSLTAGWNAEVFTKLPMP
jgi:hypothetical protein